LLAAPRLPAWACWCRFAIGGCPIGQIHCHCLCIVVDLLVAADVRTGIGRWESVMRHFLTPPLAPATLPLGMLQATFKRLLVAPACSAYALAARLLGARIGTIPLPTIAAPAHAQLLVTPCAIQQPVAGDDDRNPSSPQKAGQVPSIASLSLRDQRYRRSAHTSLKARGGYLGPSPFSEPRPPIAPPPRRKPRRLFAPRPPMQRPQVERRNRIRSTKEMVRNSD
jgi:hypothetical protein